jgi:hypothetical protein
MNKKRDTKVKRQAYIFIGMVVIALIIVFSTLYLAYVEYSNNNLKFPVGAITDIHLWGHINGQPEYDVNSHLAYIATTKQQQEQGFMNQTSYGPGNMLFLFNSNTTHCFWNKNTGTNLTLYQIDWYSQSQQPFNIYWAEEGNPPASNKFGVVKLITTLQAYNTTPECTVSDAVIESTRPQPLSVGDFISVVYNDK